VGSGARLAAYEQAVPAYHPGDTVHLFLRWSAGAGQAIRVSLLDRAGAEVVGQATSVPHLPQGTAGRQRIDLRVPPDAAPGRHVFGIQQPADSHALPFGRVIVRPRIAAVGQPPSVNISSPLELDFGDGVRLLGYDLGIETVEPGSTVPLTLYWQAREPVEQRYKVFTHLLGETYNARRGSFLWGQQDNEPAGGTRATSSWRVGEIIVDKYGITLDTGIPSGRYAIEIGLYEPATGERLSVLDGDGNAAADHLILTYVQVEPN
jgi:hypothetical protein